MANALTRALLLSLDTFLVSMALGTLRLGRSRERRLAALFSLCDGLASVVGYLIAGVLLSEADWFGKLGVWSLCFYAGLIVFLGCSARGAMRFQNGAKFLYILPVILSLDNLVAGISLGGPGVSLGLSFFGVAAASGLMSFVGLRGGSYIGAHSRVPRVALASLGLVTAATVIWFG